jgi:hypothetical protein
MSKNYFDLTKRKIDELEIAKQDNFTCNIVDRSNGDVFNGFILAITQKTEDKRICEISWQKSSTDKKYQPRLIFRKIDNNLNDKKIDAKRPVIIDFLTGENGYREFWQMIAFIFKAKDLIDTGDFIDELKVISNGQFTEFLNNKEKFGKMDDRLLDHEQRLIKLEIRK